MSAFNVLNLGILLRNYDESIISQKMLEFDCPNNSEINDFFHNKAIGSVQRHQTETFLVVDNQNQINGFYSLTHKSLEVSAANLSKTYTKKIAMYSDYDESKKSYYISAFLIAQFGKNANISKLKKYLCLLKNAESYCFSTSLQASCHHSSLFI